MRADRLVAALLILQARGRVTAAELADELEISERTARRDLEGLAMAGIPVYSQPGRGGGWSLVGGARTDLSGLTAAEARTLFLVAGPSASATPQVKAALRKLVRALPEPLRAEAEAAASAVVIDPTSWDRREVPTPPHLEVMQKAVVQGVQVRIVYRGRDRPESERTVHPLGLVSKASVWYLIANTDAGLRTFRLSRIRSLIVTEDPAERPEGFDLEEHWSTVVAEIDERRAVFRARALVDPEAVGWVRSAFGTRASVGEPAADGRIAVELRSWTVNTLAGELAAFGRWIEVVQPDEAREELARLGAELTARYGPAP
ncbi:MAG TPA: WYL domain-containing protein [Actinomycetota bacterium]|nr:WYL domain-containing protein [Actinomycetota bacterium]